MANQYGLIGKSLLHSFSRSYFEKKFEQLSLKNHDFKNFELNTIADFKKLVYDNPNLKGLSVTLPYKESIIPYLDSISAEAKEIGAVNCISFQSGKMFGHNTDVYGFSQSIKPFLDNNHERALILGTGGAAKAIAFALRRIGIDVYFVSRSEKKSTNVFFYEEINKVIINSFKLIVNCTPLGTFPNETECPALPYSFMSPQHMAYDLIYNPEQTQFLKHAADKGAITVNGLSMLQFQADKSWEIWHDN